MPDTIREQIIAATVTRLQTIRTASGYKTNMGLNVQRAALHFPDSTLPGLSVLPRIEESERQYGLQVSTMPVEVLGLVAHGNTNPSVIAEQMHGDMIKCLLSQPKLSALMDDIEYKGGGTDEYPDSSDTATAVTVIVNIKYTTKIGDPYSQ